MVDFSDTVIYLITLVAPAVLAVVNHLGNVTLAWLRTKSPFFFLVPEEVVADNLQKAVEASVAYAKALAKEKSPVIKTDNEFYLNALGYLKDSVPQAIDRFGFTDERLKEMIMARVTKIVG